MDNVFVLVLPFELFFAIMSVSRSIRLAGGFLTSFMVLLLVGMFSLSHIDSVRVLFLV